MTVEQDQKMIAVPVSFMKGAFCRNKRSTESATPKENERQAISIPIGRLEEELIRNAIVDSDSVEELVVVARELVNQT
ncbi:16593_t:CDS:1, partial [Gigaspora margarita]